MIDPTTPPEPESAPEVLITPQQQFDIVTAHKSRPPEAPVTRSTVISTVRDILNGSSLNGWPMSFDGGNISVSTAAMDSTQSSTTQRSPGGAQPLQVPQFKVTISPPRVPVQAVPEPVVIRAPVPQGNVLPPQVPSAPVAAASPVVVQTVAEVPEAKAITPPLMVGVYTGTALDSAAYNQRSAVSHKRSVDPTIGKHNPHRPHDSTMTGETLIPVRLKRADGQRTVLAFIDAPTSYVLDGAVSGERVLALPATDTFYDAQGGGGTITPFGMTSVLDSGTLKVQVNQYSYLFNADMLGGVYTITSFASLFVPAVGDYAYLEISQDDTGAITDIELKLDAGWAALPAFYTIDSSDPANPFVDSFYLPIAKFVDPSNGALGETISVGDPATPTPIKVLQGTMQNLLLVNRVMAGVIGWTVESYGAII